MPSIPVEAPCRPILTQYREVRRLTEQLCEPLEVEDYVAQSMPDASPVKWHLAHTSWFFETFLLMPSLPGYRPFSPQFSYLFNSYYNAIGERMPRPQRGLVTRPSVGEVFRYRAHVNAGMEQLLEANPDDASLVILGLHHEQQHQELLLTDVKHLFSCNPLRPAYQERPAERAGSVPSLRWKSYRAGLHQIGHADDGFAFDNEGPRHRVYLEAFALADRPITNSEYQEFLDAGGYDRPEFWLSDGWSLRCAEGWQAPLYWERRGDRWWTLTLAGMRPVEEAEPVCHVSYYEADAFARWSAARLPTEAEWEVAAAHAPLRGNFLDPARLHPVPLGVSDSDDGPARLFGDVWEWTSSPYTAYPGYRPRVGALGEYNAKFMVNQMVLRGGSCVTPPGHMRRTYRNFFPPSARWQFMGIRLARDVE